MSGAEFGNERAIEIGVRQRLVNRAGHSVANIAGRPTNGVVNSHEQHHASFRSTKHLR